MIAALAGYLIGTISFADLAARLATGSSTTLRTQGSTNPGAANAMGVLGRGWGIAVMVADIGKGIAACAVGRRLAGERGAHVAGSAAVVGHCYPMWTGFRGGKGVATSGGQILATFPGGLPIPAVAAAVMSRVPGDRKAERVTVVACAAWVAGAVVWWRRRLPNLWGPPPSAALPLAAAASSAVVLRRFRSGNATTSVSLTH